MRVLVLGGGVAGLETCLALRALAGDRVHVTLIAPDRYVSYRPVGVRDPLDVHARVCVPLARVAAAARAELRHDRVVSIDPSQRRVYTSAGYELQYDALVVAVGAAPAPVPPRAEPFDEARAAGCRALVRKLHEGRIASLAFVEPSAPTHAFDLYDLAVQTAVSLRRGGVEAELTLVTAEPAPLAILGARAAAQLRSTLGAHGVHVVESAHVRSIGYGEMELAPLARRVMVERVIAAPRLAGPRLKRPAERSRGLRSRRSARPGSGAGRRVRSRRLHRIPRQAPIARGPAGRRRRLGDRGGNRPPRRRGALQAGTALHPARPSSGGTSTRR